MAKKSHPFSGMNGLRLQLDLSSPAFQYCCCLLLFPISLPGRLTRVLNGERFFPILISSVDNWSGKVGAWFANLFLNKWFGIASFTIPFLLLLMGLKLMHVKILPLGRTLRITLVFTILVIHLAGLYIWECRWFSGQRSGRPARIIRQ